MLMGDRISAPSGVVTFVFSDIEGSTRLFHALGDRYADVLERHREILREAWSAHQGFEVSAEGDEFMVAFSSALDAVAACLRGQRALRDEPWPDDGALRVRMGVHTGLASPQGDRYVSLAVHETARVMAAAHGGQVLISEHTAAELGGTGEPELRSLGTFRLRGFDHPLRLYELAGLAPEGGFPAVRAVPADGHNLVRLPTRTVGREEVIETVASELGPGRVVTLVGPGGVGKTRLATEIGMRIAPHWRDGVWLVDLASVGDGSLVGAAVADAVGAPVEPGRDRSADALAYLGTREAVVILDNCEHLVAACAELVDSLLTSAPGTAVLATSREPLRIAGEALRPVEPLEVTRDAGPSATDVLASPAGRLFAERGASARPGFEVDADNAIAVSRICRMLDGLPLLIELAAARLSVQSPTEILGGLEGRLTALASRDRLVPDRHRTVEALLTWSYELLDEDERAAFRRLAVFGASFSADTATPAIAHDGIDAVEAAQLLWGLVDRSLVTADLGANQTRYRLLETVRSYGRRLLDEHEETGEVATRLTEWFLERVGPWLPVNRAWLTDAEVELDNLRALIRLVPEQHEELAQQLACTIGRFHHASQSFREGVKELQRYVDLLPRPTPARVALITALADLLIYTGDLRPADDLLTEASAVQERYGPPHWNDAGIDRARGEIARRSGDLAAAAEIARGALDRQLSDRGRCRMFNLLGITLPALGDLEGAYQAFAHQLELGRAIGDENYIEVALGNLAEIALRLGDLPAAAAHQRACLDLASERGLPMTVAFSFIVAARLAGARDDWPTATRLYGRADELLGASGWTLYEDDQEEIRDLLDRARSELGTEAFERIRKEGEVMTLPMAVRDADEVLAATAETA